MEARVILARIGGAMRAGRNPPPIRPVDRFPAPSGGIVGNGHADAAPATRAAPRLFEIPFGGYLIVVEREERRPCQRLHSEEHERLAMLERAFLTVAGISFVALVILMVLAVVR